MELCLFVVMFVLGMLKGRFSLGTLRLFQGLIVLKSFNGLLRQFKGCLKFNGSFKDVSRKF